MVVHTRIILLGVGLLLALSGLHAGTVAPSRTAPAGYDMAPAPSPAATIPSAPVKALASTAYGSIAIGH